MTKVDRFLSRLVAAYRDGIQILGDKEHQKLLLRAENSLCVGNFRDLDSLLDASFRQQFTRPDHIALAISQLCLESARNFCNVESFHPGDLESIDISRIKSGIERLQQSIKFSNIAIDLHNNPTPTFLSHSDVPLGAHTMLGCVSIYVGKLHEYDPSSSVDLGVKYFPDAFASLNWALTHLDNRLKNLEAVNSTGAATLRVLEQWKSRAFVFGFYSTNVCVGDALPKDVKSGILEKAEVVILQALEKFSRNENSDTSEKFLRMLSEIRLLSGTLKNDLAIPQRS
jgi:hypothetical protein